MVDIHNSLKRFEVAWRRVASLEDAELLLAFFKGQEKPLEKAEADHSEEKRENLTTKPVYTNF